MLAPLGGQVAAKLDNTGLGGVVGGADETAVGNGAGHGGNHDNGASALVLDHLASCSRGSHHGTSDVDREHGVGVLGAVLEGGGLLLDTGGGDEAVQALVAVGDLRDDLLEICGVTDVNLAVVELSAESLNGALLDDAEVGGRLRQTVKGVD